MEMKVNEEKSYEGGKCCEKNKGNIRYRTNPIIKGGRKANQI